MAKTRLTEPPQADRTLYYFKAPGSKHGIVVVCAECLPHCGFDAQDRKPLTVDVVLSSCDMDEWGKPTGIDAACSECAIKADLDDLPLE